MCSLDGAIGFLSVLQVRVTLRNLNCCSIMSKLQSFYRNHYSAGKRPQEAYVWPTVAEASRRAIRIRYSLLTYIYTLYYHAHTRGDTVMRALAWEFPNDISLRETDTQFLLGDSLLVTPVLEPDARSVNGVFPGIGEGTRWFDWYTLQEVKDVRPQENVTMDAPLEHINLHFRGGSVLPLQEAGYTTAETKTNPYSLLIAPDVDGCAVGDLYLDDGESLSPSETKLVEVCALCSLPPLLRILTLCLQFTYRNGRLSTRSWGSYVASPPLANITILGIEEQPIYIHLEVGSHYHSGLTTEYANEVLKISGLEEYTQAGAWGSELNLELSSTWRTR